MIQFVYFDLDDTLLDHRHAERMALQDLHGKFPILFSGLSVQQLQEEYHLHNVPLWRKYALGEINSADLRRLRFEKLIHSLSVSGAEAARFDAHYMERYAAHWTVLEGALDAFNRVADRFPVGVLTNGFSDVQAAKLERFPEIRDRLQATVVSDLVGYFKPHPALFGYAAEKAGVPPADILYIGDSYASDVEGALGAGWQAAWYTDEPAASAEEAFMRFSAWPELPRLLGL